MNCDFGKDSIDDLEWKEVACRYVCVSTGFEYTDVSNWPFFSVTRMSKNTTSVFECDDVNLIVDRILVLAEKLLQ